ncbi:hypothetical protein EV668_0058 [Enterovirga rhinocerotis]|uniref:Uncharacterized protein n=1 Tax=Enterovirga rhinocerotis TaxID=1339210 RepID=A0A4R7CB76_9HYPH|nr:hypothetical protein EV668_0058 [Enterovirga rhinocerotis]
MDQSIRKALVERLTVDLETAGAAFGLGRSAAYRSKKDLGAVRIGGRWAVPTAPLRRKLGLVETEAA